MPKKSKPIQLDTFAIERMNQAISKELSKPIPPPPPPVDVPPHPLASRWAMKGMKLSPTRNRYFIALPLPYLGVLQECGVPLANTRHILEIYLLPDQATIVSDAVQDKHPIARLMTNPFYFHNSDEAIKAVNEALPEISELI